MEPRKTAKNRIFLIIAAALVLCAALCLSACPSRQDNRYSLSSDLSFSLSNLDKVVETIRSALKNRSMGFSVSFVLKGEYMEDISPLVKELMDLAELPTGASDEGDYIRYQLGGYTFSYGHEPSRGGFLYTVTVTPDYYSSLDQELETSQRAEEILKALPVSNSSKEEEKVRAVYDYLKDNVKYDTVHKKNDYNTVKSTAYGALVNGSAGCQGYAVAMYRLLMSLGVECHVITGRGESTSGTESHAWVIVRLGDKFYNVDPTWSDPARGDLYYLKGSVDFPDHVPDEIFDGLYDISEYAYIQ